MLIKDFVGLKGVYTFFNQNGEIDVFENVVVQNVFSGLFGALNGVAPLIQITHLAVGTGTTTASRNDTALVTETYRKPISVITVSNTGVLVKTNFAPGEITGVFKEIGIFAGSTLISRANIDKTINAADQFLVTYTLTGV